MDAWWNRLWLDHDRLWRAMRRLALVGAPAAATALFSCGPCPEPEEAIYLIRTPDADTQALINMCRQQARAAACQTLCRKLATGVVGPWGVDHCELHTDKDGYTRVHVGYIPDCPGGRRPEGLAITEAMVQASPAGNWLAHLAALEAASVPAFARLAAELGAHGAPAGLVRAAEAAAADEVVHARVASTLATGYGAVPKRAHVDSKLDLRSLEAMMIENAVEGCVRETYGALLALRQAATAADPVLRQAFAGIAADESRHAALAWAAGAWAETRLGSAARARVRQARAEAVATLGTELEAGLPAAALATLGLPDETEARQMLAGLGDLLWNA